MATKLEIIATKPGRSPVYGKEISGRCHKCNARFLWPAKLGKLKDMFCPFCNSRLSNTTHVFKGATYELQEGMKEYRLYHRISKEFKDVSANSAQEACQMVGWLIGDVWVRELTDRIPNPKSESGSGFSGGGWKNVTPREVK